MQPSCSTFSFTTATSIILRINCRHSTEPRKPRKDALLNFNSSLKFSTEAYIPGSRPLTRPPTGIKFFARKYPIKLCGPLQLFNQFAWKSLRKRSNLHTLASCRRGQVFVSRDIATPVINTLMSLLSDYAEMLLAVVAFGRRIKLLIPRLEFAVGAMRRFWTFLSNILCWRTRQTAIIAGGQSRRTQTFFLNIYIQTRRKQLI